MFLISVFFRHRVKVVIFILFLEHVSLFLEHCFFIDLRRRRSPSRTSFCFLNIVSLFLGQCFLNIVSIWFSWTMFLEHCFFIALRIKEEIVKSPSRTSLFSPFFFPWHICFFSFFFPFVARWIFSHFFSFLLFSLLKKRIIIDHFHISHNTLCLPPPPPSSFCKIWAANKV